MSKNLGSQKSSIKKEIRSKKPVAVMITDTHLEDSTIKINEDIYAQVIDLCLSLGVKQIIHGGDVFESRKGQTEVALTTFGKILERLSDNDIEMIAIAGNHDKTDYSSEESFLNPFSKHNSFLLVKHHDHFWLSPRLIVSMIPYFDEKLMYGQVLAECIEDLNYEMRADNSSIHKKLITHVAIDGVKNNSGEAVSGSIAQSRFEVFDSVEVGHYHNRQIVSNKITYVGSTHQANFGEDNEKGCTIIYDDGSTKLHQLKFPQYKTHTIDIAKVTASELKAFIDGNEGEKLRVEMRGDKSVMLDQSIKALLVANKVKIEDKRLVTTLEHTQQEIKVFTNNDLLSGLEEWAADRKPANLEFGRQLFIKALDVCGSH